MKVAVKLETTGEIFIFVNGHFIKSTPDLIVQILNNAIHDLLPDINISAYLDSDCISMIAIHGIRSIILTNMAEYYCTCHDTLRDWYNSMVCEISKIKDWYNSLNSQEEILTL